MDIKYFKFRGASVKIKCLQCGYSDVVAGASCLPKYCPGCNTSDRLVIIDTTGSSENWIMPAGDVAWRVIPNQPKGKVELEGSLT